MEHDEATRSHAAERYVAHELSPAERDAFEEHFFDCRECAGDVRFELSFAANIRAVSRQQREQLQPALAPAAISARKWREWLRRRPSLAFSFAANFVLLAGFGYVLLTGTHDSAVARFTQPYFAPGPTHGAVDVHAVPPGERSYAVRFPAPAAASQTYSYEVLDANGKRQRSGSLPSPAIADGFLYLEIPLDSLPRGIHTLVVRGDAGGEMFSWSKLQNSP
jgi:anti-sigma factor RsiW